ncbi:MAG TPA: hypothetical protein VHT75_20270, partial [Acidimicrobiales bacterium]|nr:hypothetical protein [Acidimicrobiales bacterium]
LLVPGDDGEDVADDVPLTQLGHADLRQTLNWSRINISFRCAPGQNDEGYVSLVEGRLTVAQAVPMIARGDKEGSADCVRHTEAGILSKAGFKVVYKPEPTVPGHVAVSATADWDENMSQLFDECFIEYVRGLLR